MLAKLACVTLCLLVHTLFCFIFIAFCYMSLPAGSHYVFHSILLHILTSWPSIFCGCFFFFFFFVAIILTCCHTYLSQIYLKKTLNFMAPFYGWGSIASRLEPLEGGSLLFSWYSFDRPLQDERLSQP